MYKKIVDRYQHFQKFWAFPSSKISLWLLNKSSSPRIYKWTNESEYTLSSKGISVPSARSDFPVPPGAWLSITPRALAANTLFHRSSSSRCIDGRGNWSSSYHGTCWRRHVLQQISVVRLWKKVCRDKLSGRVKVMSYRLELVQRT